MSTCTSQGKFEPDAALAVWERAFRAAIEADRKAVLVDVREVGGRVPSTMERYQQGEYIGTLQIEPDTKKEAAPILVLARPLL